MTTEGKNPATDATPARRVGGTPHGGDQCADSEGLLEDRATERPQRPPVPSEEPEIARADDHGEGRRPRVGAERLDQPQPDEPAAQPQLGEQQIGPLAPDEGERAARRWQEVTLPPGLAEDDAEHLPQPCILFNTRNPHGRTLSHIAPLSFPRTRQKVPSAVTDGTFLAVARRGNCPR